MHIILIKFVSQMEHYLTIWFNTGNLYLLNFSFARKSFYRKTIPLIKNLPPNLKKNRNNSPIKASSRKWMFIKFCGNGYRPGI